MEVALDPQTHHRVFASQEDIPEMEYQCTMCHQPVKLYGGNKQRRHFRHVYGTQDATCEFAVQQSSQQSSQQASQQASQQTSQQEEPESSPLPALLPPSSLQIRSSRSRAGILIVVVALLLATAAVLTALH